MDIMEEEDVFFSMRGGGFGDGGYTITFRNINIEDPRPTKQIFKILMEGK